MIKHIQTKLHSNEVIGNCWPTAIACILECRIDQVPNFEELFRVPDMPWFWVLEEWLKYKGYKYVGGGEREDYIDFDGYYFVTGKSPRGDFNHIVIYKDGKMVHDPHPSGDGILTEEVWEHLEKISDEHQ